MYPLSGGLDSRATWQPPWRLKSSKVLCSPPAAPRGLLTPKLAKMVRAKSEHRKSQWTIPKMISPVRDA